MDTHLKSWWQMLINEDEESWDFLRKKSRKKENYRKIKDGWEQEKRLVSFWKIFFFLFGQLLAKIFFSRAEAIHGERLENMIGANSFDELWDHRSPHPGLGLTGNHRSVYKKSHFPGQTKLNFPDPPIFWFIAENTTDLTFAYEAWTRRRHPQRKSL